MSWFPYAHRDYRLAQKEIELKEKNKELFDQRLNQRIQEIINHPYVNKILVAIVHEDLTLERMYIHKNKIIDYSKEIDSVEKLYKPEKKKEKLLESLSFKLSNSIKLFWKNQNKFLKFIDLENTCRIFDEASIGYTSHYSWVLSGEKNFKDKEGNPFFGKYEEYQEKFKHMTCIELQAEREKNWKIYNNLCIVMHEFASKYDSIDSVLIPNIEENYNGQVCFY